ncbi:MAG TPA: FAD-dependent oxidoreductase [Micromonospora sp.]
MSLRHVHEVVVASADVAAAVQFHRQAFGFEVLAGSVDSADGVLLGVPGSPSGRLRLVPASAAPTTPPNVWDPGPRLLGIYSRDLDATVEAIAAAGGAPRTPVTYAYGGGSLSELVARGADGVWWTIPKAVAGAHRPSPALEGDAQRLHSELHTVVLVVDSQEHDAAVQFFTSAGMRAIFDGTMAGAEFEELVGMPPGAQLRLAFLVGPDAAPARLEIMSFTGVPVTPRTAEPVGITRIVFAADDPSATRQALLAAGAEDLGDGVLRGPVGVEIALVPAAETAAPATEAADAGRTIVVIGGGSSGLCTAIAAAQNGAHVHLVEKQSRIGGMLHIANGEFSGAGTRRQRERGIDDDPQRHFEDVLRLSHGKVNRELAWLSVSLQGELVDWLDENGFEFHPDTPGLVHGHEVYSVPRTYWGVKYGLSVLQLLERMLTPLVESGRVTLHLNTRVTKLVTVDGRVCGVQVRRSDGSGEEWQIRGDAVVLATGGYDANVELRNQFLPEHCRSALIGCLDHATGDGLLMARELGAAVSHDGIFLPVMGLIPDPNRPGFAVDYREAFLEMAPAYRTPYEIWVNKRGERFVAEDTTSPEQRERALLEQPDVTMYVVFDQTAVENAPVPLIRNNTGDWTKERFAEACRTSPWVTRADTLAELAEKLGIDPERLVATVERYNAAVDSGTDPDFGRTTLPTRIATPPFYAVTSVAASILSRDGLRVNTDMQVLTEAGTPIPGLYAVGEVLGNNVFAGDNYVGGMSVTPAMTLGRRLGARLAAAVK